MCGSLSEVSADEEAKKRRRAEYVVLTLLTRAGPIDVDEIDYEILDIHKDLRNTNIDSPFNFGLRGSNAPSSDHLNRSIEWLLSYGQIDIAGTKYKITKKGKEYLENQDELELDGINSEFQTVVNSVISENI